MKCLYRALGYILLCVVLLFSLVLVNEFTASQEGANAESPAQAADSSATVDASLADANSEAIPDGGAKTKESDGASQISETPVWKSEFAAKTATSEGGDKAPSEINAASGANLTPDKSDSGDTATSAEAQASNSSDLGNIDSSDPNARRQARLEREKRKILSAEENLPQSELSSKVDERTIMKFQHMRYLRIYIVKNLRQSGYDGLADFFVAEFMGTRVITICIAALVLLLTWIFQALIVNIIFGILRCFFEKLHFSHINKMLDKLRKPMRFFVILIGVSLAFITLVRETSVMLLGGRIFAAIGLALIFWMLLSIVDFSFTMLAKRMERKNSSAQHLVYLLGRIFEYTLVFVAVLMVLDHMGVKISALVASLGIGGAALAFASKDTIANLFGSISIVADRPFVLGDWVKVGDVEGIVDNVGVRSTRIRTFQKTLVTIPNSVLANESVDNYSKMPTRKVVMTVGLTYSTTAEQIEQIVAEFKEILNKNPGVENGSELVNFVNFGASSLDIQLIYYTYNTDLAGYLQTMQSVNLSIMRAVEARGLSFAFPSTSLYIEKK